MIPLLLYVLAVLDAAFVGFRAAAGRNAAIDKRAYYRGAVLRGAALGHLCIAAGALAVTLAVATAPAPGAAWDNLVSAGTSMLWVYGVYATAVLAAFVPYLSRSDDVRTLTTVAIFGPLTLLRPWVILAGAAVAIVQVPQARVAACVVVAAGSLIAFEPLLDRRLQHLNEIDVAIDRTTL